MTQSTLEGKADLAWPQFKQLGYVSLFPSSNGTSTLSDNLSQGSLMADHSIRPPENGPSEEFEGSLSATKVEQVTIDMLPDTALLEIFDFCKVDTDVAPLGDYLSLWHWSPRWKTLSQVCQKWRRVVFGSPLRLDIGIICTEKTPISTLLDVWPTLPIIVMCLPWRSVYEKGVENLIAALEHRDRISRIYILTLISPLQKLVAAMEGPFPILTLFHLTRAHRSLTALPETFLGGSAPRLRSFLVWGTPFPTLPQFALSATQITDLDLLDLRFSQESGYFSPEVMVTCMATLRNLESLSLGIRFLRSSPDRSSSPPPTSAVLPALTSLYFKSSSEYFNDLVARIDTPVLERLTVAFFQDTISHTRPFHDFIERAKTLRPFDQATVEVSGRAIKIILGSPIGFELQIRWEGPEPQGSQLSSMTQMLSHHSPRLLCVGQLEIREARWESYEWREDPQMGSSPWLELFRLFFSTQNLYVARKLVRPVAAVLQELNGERAMEVLPALRNLYFEGLHPCEPAQELMPSFLNSRQLSDHHIVVQRWDRCGLAC